MLVERLGDTFPDTPPPKLISPDTSLKNSSHFPYFHVARTGAYFPLPFPPIPGGNDPVSPKPGTMPRNGIGAGCMFVKLMGEKGGRMSLARDHLSLYPTLLLLLPMVLRPGGGSGLRCRL